MNGSLLARWVLVLVCAGGVASDTWAQSTWYVDDDAFVGGDGTSWNTAFVDLQSALDVAISGDEIHVAGGVYIPSVQFDPGVPRTETFLLPVDVNLRGGYAGLANSTSPDQRDYEMYASILSGELGGESCYHVVYTVGGADTTVLQGFTVTGGDARDVAHAEGGGLIFTNGDMRRVMHCTFVRNRAYYGGGVHVRDGSAPLLISCSFYGNDALLGGGTMVNGGYPGLMNCRFAGNTALYGGGIFNSNASDTVVFDCSLVMNQAYHGSEVYSYDLSSVVSANCIYRDDSNFGLEADEYSWIGVEYSVVTNGWDGEGNLDEDPALIRMPDPGADAVWGTPDDDYGDLRLTALSPCIDAGNNTAVPAYIAGDCGCHTRFIDDPDTEDTGLGEPPIVDIGAFEFADCNDNDVSDDIDIEAETSEDCNLNHVPDECDVANGDSADENGNGIPDECEGPSCPGDLNGDNVRDLSDLAQLLGHYGINDARYEDGDLDDDGDVDLSDLAALLSVYDVPCP